MVRGDNPRYNLIYPRYPKIQKASFIKIIKGFSTRLHWCRCECAERGFRFRVASASYSVWQDFACSWGGVNEQYEESGGDYSCLVASKSALVSMMCLYYIYIYMIIWYVNNIHMHMLCVFFWMERFSSILCLLKIGKIQENLSKQSMFFSGWTLMATGGFWGSSWKEKCMASLGSKMKLIHFFSRRFMSYCVSTRLLNA